MSRWPLGCRGSVGWEEPGEPRTGWWPSSFWAPQAEIVSSDSGGRNFFQKPWLTVYLEVRSRFELRVPLSESMGHYQNEIIWLITLGELLDFSRIISWSTINKFIIGLRWLKQWLAGHEDLSSIPTSAQLCLSPLRTMEVGCVNLRFTIVEQKMDS